MTHLLRLRGLHVDALQVQAGGFSSCHYHVGKVNWFQIENGRLAVSVYGSFSARVISRPVRVHYLTAGEMLAIDAGVVHRFACLESSRLVECYWPAEGSRDVVEHDIVRLDNNGTCEVGQLAEAVAYHITTREG